jgi:gamma-glutamylcysteine synthetase
MKEAAVREKLFEKYILPTRGNHNRYIGAEVELPIVNLGQDPVDFDLVHEVANRFITAFGFEAVGLDDEGNVYMAEDKATGDNLSFDCSYNNLELSMGREANLKDIESRLKEYIEFLQGEFGKGNHMLTGMGVNPHRAYNNHVPIPNGRYRMLYHHLQSYVDYDLPMYFHNHPEYGMFSSASQVQLDVEEGELVKVLNVFTKLEPVKTVLFSNSVLLGEDHNMLCCRDMLWENSTHGINPHNIGMYNCELQSVEDVLSYLESTSIYCVEREGEYINFPPVNIVDYFKKASVEGEFYNQGSYEKVIVKPRESDLDYLRTFKFEDLTYRGTVEFRSVCCQPIKDIMVVPAFHVGVMAELDRARDLLDGDTVIYGHGYNAGELRKMFNMRHYPDFVDEDKLYELCCQIVDIAKSGLVKRGLGEEYMLDPLYDRIDKRTNPARTLLDAWDEGASLEEFILGYGAVR